MKVFFSAVVSAGRKGSFYDHLIAWYSRSPYVHVEFHWPPNQMDPEGYLGAQPKGGVEIRPLGYLKGATRHTFSVVVPDKQYDRLVSYLLRQTRKPYDMRAILGMAFPFLDRGHTQNAWFCSELVYGALAEVGCHLLRVPQRLSDRITPRDVTVSPKVTRIAR